MENLKVGATVLESNRDLYLAKRQELLERAQFWGASNQFLGTSRNTMLFGAALAAIGGIGFQLALSSPEADNNQADGAPGGPYPRAAELVQVDSPAGLALWAAAKLAACQVPSALPPTVPVTILSGSGSADDPFSVSTVSTNTCQAKTFPLINEVGLIVEHPKLTIEYRPAPTSAPPSPTSASPSPTKTP